MRYVPLGAVRQNMILGKNVYGEKGQLLLNAGTTITDNYINAIKEMGFSGVYVQDSLSEDIEIECIISDELRQKAIEAVKRVFISIENREELYDQVEYLKEQLVSILEEILNNENLMINMIDLKSFDEYTYQHSVNVSILSMVVGIALNLSKKDIYNLGLSGLLHDIGKIFVPKEVLNKPGRLDEKEFEIIKNHPLQGYEYLKEHFTFVDATYMGVLDHHEKYDGTGYPNNKKGDEISIFGRIINVVDVYDALTAKRPYRDGLQPSEAIEYLMGGSGSLFDPKIVELFVKKIAAYPLGTCVKLTNGYEGIVVKNYEEAFLRPTLRIYKIDGIKVDPIIIDLKSDIRYLNVVIEKIIN